MARIVVTGHWGSASRKDIEAVVRSAATTLLGNKSYTKLRVRVEPTPSNTDLPVTLPIPNAKGEIVVQLPVRDTHWAQLTFQFSHELCHVIANIQTWQGNSYKYGWIEESICEAASLYTLRAMSKGWSSNPPHPYLRSYSKELWKYAESRMSDPKHTLPTGAAFSCWLEEQIPLLETNPLRREENTIIAKALLPTFEQHHNCWRVIRFLHDPNALIPKSRKDFFDSWEERTPEDLRTVIVPIRDHLESQI